MIALLCGRLVQARAQTVVLPLWIHWGLLALLTWVRWITGGPFLGKQRVSPMGVILLRV